MSIQAVAPTPACVRELRAAWTRGVMAGSPGIPDAGGCFRVGAGSP